MSSKLFNLEPPYFWILAGLLAILMLICCFYLGMLVCWWKYRSSKAKFNESTKKDKNQLSPGSDYSTDTLNTDNFIRWRSKPGSKQNLEKRSRSLFKNDFKSNSLGKLKRKEIGSSPSNEFEYISFSSDTTNSSLQRDDSIKKINNQQTAVIRHHPYNQQDLNRNFRKTKDFEKDYQQDYLQDYQTEVIQKASSQLHQPNSIKLLISRGVQNNLLNANDYQFNANSNSSTKKFPLEMPFNSSYYGNNVSVLNLSKEKLIPLNQYTSDSSTTTTTNNTINDRDYLNNKKKSIELDKNLDSNADKKTDRNLGKKQLNSRPQSLNEPKRSIKKEIIEEFETITTTTFKNSPSKRSSPNLANQQDAQLNEQTKSIINAIRDELKKFNTTQSTIPHQLKKN